MRLAVFLFAFVFSSLPAYSVKMVQEVGSQEINLAEKKSLRKKIKSGKRSKPNWKKAFSKIRLFKMNILGWILSLSLGVLGIFAVLVDKNYGPKILNVLFSLLVVKLLLIGFCISYAVAVIVSRIIGKKKKEKKRKRVSYKKCFKF